jgi:hypothetical protein
MCVLDHARVVRRSGNAKGLLRPKIVGKFSLILIIGKTHYVKLLNMLFPAWITEQIAQSAYWADRAIRSELAEGLISTENDYTSNLTSTFRRNINARAIPSLHATSYVLRPTVERALGADACIVLQNTKQFKLCIFEAKWPRLSTHKDYWDSLQLSSGNSHFDEQLSRQSPRARAIATWEMFYCESPFGHQPHFIPSHVSACVWHEDAIAVSNARPMKTVPWTNLELSSMLSSSGKQIDEIIKEVCACRKGQPFSGTNYLAAFEDIGIPREILVIRYSPPNGRDN